MNWKLKRDYLTEVLNGIARFCDLCGNFAPFAVKVSSFLQFPKIEPIIIISFEHFQFFIQVFPCSIAVLKAQGKEFLAVKAKPNFMTVNSGYPKGNTSFL